MESTSLHILLSVTLPKWQMAQMLIASFEDTQIQKRSYPLVYPFCYIPSGTKNSQILIISDSTKINGAVIIADDESLKRGVCPGWQLVFSYVTGKIEVICTCLSAKYLYIKIITVYVPSSELGLSQPLSRKLVCPYPQNRGRGGTRLRVRGWGSPNSDDLRKSLALFPTIWEKA